LSGFRDRVEAQYANAVYPAGTSLAGGKFDAANGTVGRYSADVMIPAFLSTYTSMGGKSLGIFPALSRMLPNWTIRYSGLGRLPWFRDVFKSVTLSHSYVSVYAVGAYSSYSTFAEYMNGLGFVNDATTGNPVPSSMFNVSTVTLSSAFSPLLGFDFTFNNNMTLRVDYKTQRALTLSMTSVQINESVSKDWTLGWGWTLNNFDLFGGGNHRKVKVVRNGGTGVNGQNNQPARTTATAARQTGGINHDLKLRLDFTYRKQASLTRDIATMTSAASSGTSNLNIQFSAEYTLSRILSLSFYYDRTTNTPLLSSSSYPTTTQDFGLSMKFSLTR
jgi:cell surface protein SprA